MADGARRPRTSKTRPASHLRAQTTKGQRGPRNARLFLVRWPDLSAALITARDVADAMAKLDELGDPGGCTCVEFDGPVWLELGLPIEFSMPKRGAADETIAVRVPDDIAEVALKPTIANTDTGSIFADRLLEVAFPEIAAVLALRRAGDPNAEAARGDLERAVRRELVPLLQHQWRRDAQRRRAREGDRDAELREVADLTVDPPRRKRRR